MKTILLLITIIFSTGMSATEFNIGPLRANFESNDWYQYQSKKVQSLAHGAFESNKVKGLRIWVSQETLLEKGNSNLVITNLCNNKGQEASAMILKFNGEFFCQLRNDNEVIFTHFYKVNDKDLFGFLTTFRIPSNTNESQEKELIAFFKNLDLRSVK